MTQLSIAETNIQNLRKEQTEEARRMTSREEGQESAVTRRPVMTLKGGMRPQSSGNSKQVAKPVKGHEAFLKALEASNASVQLEKISSDKVLTGTIRHSDKYTLTLRVARDGGGYTDKVIFKHDISEFSALTHRAIATQAAESVNA